MGVNRANPGDASVNPQDQTQAPPVYGQPHQQNWQQQPQNGFGDPSQTQQPQRSNIGALRGFSRTVTRSGGSESAHAFIAKFQECLEGQLHKGTFTLLPLTPEVNGTILPAITVSKSTTIAGGTVVIGVHTLIVETKRLDARTINTQPNVQVPLESVPGDIYNDQMWQIVAKQMKDHYGQAAVIYEGSASVIPMEVDVEDKSTVNSIISYATDAAEGILRECVPELKRVFSADLLRGANGRTIARLDWNPPPVGTSAGLPIRNDVSITLSYSENQNQNDFSNNTVDLAIVDGYIDLNYVTPQAVGYGQIPTTQHYFPRFVITNIDSLIGQNTLELTLFSIACAAIIARNGAWTRVFQPKFGNATGNTNLRNLGAIGYDLPGLTNGGAGGNIDLTTDPGSVLDLINQAIHNHLIISFDIPETGELSWLQIVFHTAARGDQNSINTIVNAANTLTGNHFHNRLAMLPQRQIALDDQNRIHLGYYVENGQKIDIRTIDYLAMLNLVGGRDITIAHNYDRTYSPDMPLVERLDQRLRILNTATGEGGLHLKGYAQRITFPPAILDALIGSLQDAGVVVTPSNIHYDGQTQQRRTFQQLAPLAWQPQFGNFFYDGGTGWNNQYSMTPRFGSWSY